MKLRRKSPDLCQHPKIKFQSKLSNLWTRSCIVFKQVQTSNLQLQVLFLLQHLLLVCQSSGHMSSQIQLDRQSSDVLYYHWIDWSGRRDEPDAHSTGWIHMSAEENKCNLTSKSDFVTLYRFDILLSIQTNIFKVQNTHSNLQNTHSKYWNINFYSCHRKCT